MVRILVSRYGSPDDRKNQKDGITVGVATSYAEFLNLIKEYSHVFFGYTDENGVALTYEQVEKRFGQETYTYPIHYDPISGEEW